MYITLYTKTYILVVTYASTGYAVIAPLYYCIEVATPYAPPL